MKIHRSVSEKRTYRSVNDEFISREFVAGQDIDIPDDASPEYKQYAEIKLVHDLRAQVLSMFVLEGMITETDFANRMSVYEGLVDAAFAAMTAPRPVAVDAPAGAA